MVEEWIQVWQTDGVGYRLHSSENKNDIYERSVQEKEGQDRYMYMHVEITNWCSYFPTVPSPKSLPQLVL